MTNPTVSRFQQLISPPGMNIAHGTLRPAQREALLRAVEIRRQGLGLLLADDMAMGKTLICLSLGAVMGAKRILVVCPAIAKERVWAQETKKWYPSWSAQVVNGVSPITKWPAAAPVQLVAINYEILYAHVDELIGWKPDLMVLDESHYIKTPGEQRVPLRRGPVRSRPEKLPQRIVGSRRTWAAQTIAAQVRQSGGWVVAASGTPMINSAIELMPQLEAIGAFVPLFGSHAKFAVEYCGGKQITQVIGRGRRRQVWVYDRYRSPQDCQQRLQALHRELSAVMIRRTKAEQMPELVAAASQSVECEPLDAAVMEQYRKAEEDIADYMAERAQREALEKGFSPYQAAAQARLRALSAEDLVRLNTLREHVGRAKVPGVVRFVRELFRRDELLTAWDERAPGDVFKVVVFAHHRQVLEQLAQELDAPLIIGGAGKANQRAMNAFQSDPKIRSIVASITAAGVAINLNQGKAAVFGEYHWSPATHQQAVDRLCRPGQTWTVRPYFLYAPHTIDQVVSNLVRTKGYRAGALLSDQDTALKETPERVDRAVAAYLASLGSKHKRTGGPTPTEA